MAAYDYSPDGRKIADRRDECPVTERLELWLETRSFRVPRIFSHSVFEMCNLTINETVFLFPPGSDY